MVTATEIELLRSAYRDFNQGVMRSDLLTDDFILEQTSEILDTRQTFRGPGALEASFRELQTGFDTVQIEPLEIEVRDGDWLFAIVLFQASTRGIDQKIKIVHLWQMRDGRFARMRVVGAAGNAEQELAELQAGS